MGITDMQLIVEDIESRSKPTGLREQDPRSSAELGRTAYEFDMQRNLLPEQVAVRELARKIGIEVDDAETLKVKFDMFDEDRSGEIDRDEFKNVLKAFAPRTSLSKERIDAYWRDVDSDCSGRAGDENVGSWGKGILEEEGRGDMISDVNKKCVGK